MNRMPPRRHNRIPHTTRPLSVDHPYHVVMTFMPHGPKPHWPIMGLIMRRWMRMVSVRYGCVINFSVAMPDHVHLIVETPRGSAPLGNVLRMEDRDGTRRELLDLVGIAQHITSERD